MKHKPTSILAIAFTVLLLVSVLQAQQPLPSPNPKDNPTNSTGTTAPVKTGDDAGGYTITSSIEFGYRGLSVSGDHNKYQSDLNYRTGPRLFDSTFLMRDKSGKGWFDQMLVTATGWGADPSGQARASVENPHWYRFDATYRKFKYFRFL